MVKVNQEDPQFLAGPINKLEAKLSRGKKIQTDLEYEVKFAKSKLLRLDGVAAEIYDTHTLSDYVRLNDERHLI